MKLGIQRRRHPANPQEDRSSVLDVGSGRVDIRDFLLLVTHLFAGVQRSLG